MKLAMIVTLWLQTIIDRVNGFKISLICIMLESVDFIFTGILCCLGITSLILRIKYYDRRWGKRIYSNLSMIFAGCAWGYLGNDFGYPFFTSMSFCMCIKIILENVSFAK